MKILVVSQMYPGPEAPELGIFVAGQVAALRELGHSVEVAASRRRGIGPGKQARLFWDAIRLMVTFRPDVVYAHYLAPAGVFAALACLPFPRVGLVAAAHGGDVANIGRVPGIRLATEFLARRADGAVAVSRFLADELETRIPRFRDRVEVIDSGVDVEQTFTPGPQEEARVELVARHPDLAPWPEGTAFVFVGALSELKNVTRLADAFETLGDGSLTFIGSGPLAELLTGRARIRVVGAVPNDQVVTWLRASDVLCLPSLREGFGQVLIEAMGCERSVVATRNGGPAEFVTPDVGVLVEPTNVMDLAAGLAAASALPKPNQSARAAALAHDVRHQARRVSDLLQRAVSKRRPTLAARTGRHPA